VKEDAEIGIGKSFLIACVRGLELQDRLFSRVGAVLRLSSGVPRILGGDEVLIRLSKCNCPGEEWA